MAKKCPECGDYLGLLRWQPAPPNPSVERKKVRRLLRHLGWWFRRNGFADPRAEAQAFVRAHAGCTLRIPSEAALAEWMKAQGIPDDGVRLSRPPRPGKHRASKMWKIRRELEEPVNGEVTK